MTKQNSLIHKIILLNIYTLFLVSLWHIINGTFNNFIVPKLGLNDKQKVIFWLIIGIMTIVILFLFDRLDLIAECKEKNKHPYSQVFEQIFLGLIFILFWRATYSAYDLIFDKFFQKFGISEDFYVILINFVIAYVMFYIIYKMNRTDLLIK